MEWLVEVVLGGIIYLGSLIIVLWTAGAIYFDLGGESIFGRVLSIAWILAVVAGFLLWQPPWAPFVVLLVAFTVFLLWWIRLRPSHDRVWDPNHAQLPRIDLDGDTLSIHNFRNTDYHAENGIMPRFEARTYRLSQLCGLDALILNWGSRWMSHPMAVFDFGPDGRMCISIEVRYRKGQKFGFWRSLYRRQEIMYVVCDERDAILKRTSYLKGQDLYLYRVNVSPIPMRQFLLEYLYEIDQLVAQPRWYNGVTSNCTTSVYMQGRGRLVWDWRLLFNGGLDRMLYKRRFLDQTVPFAPLKEQSRVNEVANSAPADGFGDHIRRELSGYRLAARNQ